MRSVTKRGFVVYEDFIDTYGNRVRVKQSSSATRDACWIFVDSSDEKGESRAAHLNAEQARRVIAALQEWIDELGEPAHISALEGENARLRTEIKELNHYLGHVESELRGSQATARFVPALQEERDAAREEARRLRELLTCTYPTPSTGIQGRHACIHCGRVLIPEKSNG